MLLEKQINTQNRPLCYRVALNTGPAGYHFIREDSNGWYNKPDGFVGGFYINKDYVSSRDWYDTSQGYYNVEPPVLYSGDPLYFAIKIGWDK